MAAAEGEAEIKKTNQDGHHGGDKAFIYLLVKEIRMLCCIYNKLQFFHYNNSFTTTILIYSHKHVYFSNLKHLSVLLLCKSCMRV